MNGTISMNSIQKWWGETVYKKTADYAGVSATTVPKGRTLARRAGSRREGRVIGVR
jgi:hypothetical protein